MGCGISKTGVPISNEETKHTISENGKSVLIEESNASINKIISEPKEPSFTEETSRTVSKTAEISPVVIQGSTEEIYNVKQPKIKPLRKRKKDLVPDISIFKAIDEHAANAPVSSKTSVEELSKYLSRPAKNHLEAVRAFYKWIQLNISYDTDGYFSGNIRSCTPDAVLRNGSSVCAGYANLFDALCKHAGVTSRCISGYSKGYGYKPEEPFTLKDKTDHAWNVVLLFGEWHFVECTWGTGYMNNQNKYVRESREFWFLTEPEHFINDHFPYMDGDMGESQQWQLLPMPMDIETYNKRVKESFASRDYALRYSHNDAIILVREQVQVAMLTSGERLERFCADLHREDGTNCNEFLIAELVGLNKYVITVKPPSTSIFHLQLYGNDKKEKYLDELVDFTIKCNKVENNLQPYPKLQGVWGAEEDVTEFGFSKEACSKIRYVTDNGEAELHLPFLKKTPLVLSKMEHAKKVIDNIDGFVMLSSTSNSIVAKLRLPEIGYYKLIIFATKDEYRYQPIINLLIECMQPANPCYAFRKV